MKRLSVFLVLLLSCLSCSESDDVIDDYCVLKADEFKEDVEYADADKDQLISLCIENLKGVPACKSKYKSFMSCKVDHQDEIRKVKEDYSKALDELMSGDSYNGDEAQKLREDMEKKLPCHDKESSYNSCINEEDNHKKLISYPDLDAYIRQHIFGES